MGRPSGRAWTRLWAGNDSMVERISGLPIVEARYLFDFGRGVCVFTVVQKKTIFESLMVYLVKKKNIQDLNHSK